MNPYDDMQSSVRRRRADRSGIVQEAQSVLPQQMNEGYRSPEAGMPVMPRQDAAGDMPLMPQEGQSPWQQGGYPQQSGWPQQGYAMPPQQTGWPQQGYAAPPQQTGWMPQQNAGWNGGFEQPQEQQHRQQYDPTAGSGWQPVYQQQGGYDGGATPPRGPQLPKNWWVIPLIAAAVIVVIVFAVNAGRSASVADQERQIVNAYSDLFCEGVYVDDVYLGGMTYEQAAAAVSATAQIRRDSWNIRLMFEGQLARAIRASDVGMTVDVTAALNEAWAQGHTGADVASRKAEMDRLLEAPYRGYTAMTQGNTAAVDAILTEIANLAYSPAQDAYVAEYNPAWTYPFDIREGVPGRMLDVESIRPQLYELVNNVESGSIDLKTVEIAPSVTADQLRQNLSLRGSAYTLISTTSTEARTNNIKRAFELINGVTLKPGESFSFNGIVGQRSAANGFFKAIEYAYGEEREGYGGGVCQASTTVYLAAIKANLEIVKREQHSDKVNYTDYGKDATVNLDGKKIDLVFRNNTGSNIYIIAKYEFDPKVDKKHYYCKIDIYGESLGAGVSYDLVTEVVQILDPPADPEYIEDKKGEKVIYIDETPVLKRKASEGYVVDSYRVLYINGEEISRQFLYQDTYKAKCAQYYVGVSER